MAATQVSAVMNSYMSPHGARSTASPLVVTATTCAMIPSALSVAAARTHGPASAIARSAPAGRSGPAADPPARLCRAAPAGGAVPGAPAGGADRADTVRRRHRPDDPPPPPDEERQQQPGDRQDAADEGGDLARVVGDREAHPLPGAHVGDRPEPA